MSGGKDWTTHEQARLRSLWVEGTKADLLAAFPGRTWNALELKARSLSLPHRKTGRPRAADLNGLTPNEAAELARYRKQIKECRQRIRLNTARLTTLIAERNLLVNRGFMRKVRHENLRPTQRGPDDGPGEPGLATPVLAPTVQVSGSDRG
jgi:hypothetical protein